MSEHILFEQEIVIHDPNVEGVDINSRHRQREEGMHSFESVKAQMQQYVSDARIGIEDVMTEIEHFAKSQGEIDDATIEALISKGGSTAEMLLHYSEVEGVTNAWKHGNKCNPNKPIYWSTSLSNPEMDRWQDTQIIFQVGDTGEGFPDIAVPRTQELRQIRDEVEKLDGGRGIIMLEYFFDEARHRIADIDAVKEVNEEYGSMHVLELSKYIFQDSKTTRVVSDE